VYDTATKEFDSGCAKINMYT